LRQESDASSPGIHGRRTPSRRAKGMSSLAVVGHRSSHRRILHRSRHSRIATETVSSRERAPAVGMVVVVVVVVVGVRLRSTRSIRMTAGMSVTASGRNSRWLTLLFGFKRRPAEVAGVTRGEARNRERNRSGLTARSRRMLSCLLREKSGGRNNKQLTSDNGQ